MESYGISDVEKKKPLSVVNMLCSPSMPIHKSHQCSATNKASFAVNSEFSHVVADTNVFINHLNTLSTLQNWDLTVVVPFIGKPAQLQGLNSAVINELDGLKTRKDSVGSAARVAISFLKDTMASSSAWMGQSFRQTFLKVSPLMGHVSVCPDDRVLDCAIFFNENPESYHSVVLITDVCCFIAFSHS